MVFISFKEGKVICEVRSKFWIMVSLNTKKVDKIKNGHEEQKNKNQN